MESGPVAEGDVTIELSSALVFQGFSGSSLTLLLSHRMATPLLVGVGAVAAALAGRHLIKSGVIGGKRGADQWIRGGFKAKMDRKEAIQILGLKCVP